MNKNKSKKGSAFRSPWVLTIFGLFGVIFLVNYGFISAALQTSPGLVNEEYYKYGRQQNRIDLQYRAQSERGWQVELNIPKPWRVGQDSTISMTIKDKNGNPVTKGQAEVTAYRPSDAKADIVRELVESNESGVYEAIINLPLKGSWDINALFKKGDDKHMLNERIVAISDKPKKNSKLETVVDFIRQ